MYMEKLNDEEWEVWDDSRTEGQEEAWQTQLTSGPFTDFWIAL